uniref:Zinc finger ZPR1-type domain-containing protein n=1 Tax=Gasterosteus aculeatus aculeatus TaxID=481459 RepID=A0AAQ4PIW5_GASAC
MSVISEENVRGENLFKEIGADGEDWQPTELESMCMNCHLNGVTRLLLTKIPFFKEVIVSSFSCDNCNWSNTEIQSAGRIQDQGVCYTLKNVYAPDPDPELTTEKYTRTFEQNEDLGLNDMKTEGYQEEQPSGSGAAKH